MKYKHIVLITVLLGLMACSKVPDEHGKVKNPNTRFAFNAATEGDITTVHPAYIKFLKNPDYFEYLYEMFPYQPRLVVDPTSITVIVNRDFYLKPDYIPEDLVLFPGLTNGTDQYLRQEAADALLAMFTKAEEFGHQLVAASSYRSYEAQQRIFNRYATTYGKARANTFSALAGHSEHQLGLAVDVSSTRFNGVITSRIKDTPEGKWIRDNAHFFGFIIRYTSQNQYITGYIDEPWHLRYVGPDYASYLKSNMLTLEQAEFGPVHYGIDIERFP